MERQGRLHKKTLPDGTTTDEILIWNDTTELWEVGDLSSLTEIIPAGTVEGQMLYWNTTFGGEWTPIGTSYLKWDNANKRLGIKNSSPTSELDVTGTVTITRLLAGGVTL